MAKVALFLLRLSALAIGAALACMFFLALREPYECVPSEAVHNSQVAFKCELGYHLFGDAFAFALRLPHWAHLVGLVVCFAIVASVGRSLTGETRA